MHLTLRLKIKQLKTGFDVATSGSRSDEKDWIFVQKIKNPDMRLRTANWNANRGLDQIADFRLND